MAKMRYFPNRGTTSDVGGMISTTRRKNTYNEVRMEMERVTWRGKNRRVTIDLVGICPECGEK